MTDFIPVLAAAILSLMILILIFGNFLIFGDVTEGGKREILLGESFEVTHSVAEEIVADVDGRVFNGLLTGEEQRKEFDLERYDEVSEALIRLKVLDSNYYGNMIIGLNGKEIFRDAPVGQKTISVDPELLKRGNFLDVKAEDSTWRLWAPTVYDFELDMDIIYEGKKSQTFEFNLSKEEIVHLNYARLLVFGNRDGTGKLIVRVNGNEVFTGRTTIQTNFDPEILHVGTNRLELSAEPNTEYDISSAKITLFFE